MAAKTPSQACWTLRHTVEPPIASMVTTSKFATVATKVHHGHISAVLGCTDSIRWSAVCAPWGTRPSPRCASVNASGVCAAIDGEIGARDVRSIGACDEGHQRRHLIHRAVAIQ